MIGANVSSVMRFKLFKEAYKCTMLLDGLVLKTLDGVIRTKIEHWGRNLPQWTKALRTWGKAGVVKLKSKTTPKMANRGIMCMFVGYCKSHAENVYCMWNPETNNVHESRDVTWLKRMYFCQDPTMLEISTSVPSGVRERDANVTSSEKCDHKHNSNCEQF